MELATEGGFASYGKRVPWCSDKGSFQIEHPHTPSELKGPQGKQLVQMIVEFIMNNSISAVLAPSHFIVGLDDPWLIADRVLLQELRFELDRLGHDDMPIYYPLALPGVFLRNERKRTKLIDALAPLPADAFWLRVSPFGSSSQGASALRGYIEACSDLHLLGKPLVAEKTGYIGIGLLAFGAAGGIESGVTLGEHFDFTRLRKPPKKSKGFVPPPRVYLPELGAYLSRKYARKLFENRHMKTKFSCRDHWCCRKGAKDMLSNPRRHFIARRMAQIVRVSEVPENLRPQLYMEELLRPATDYITRASKIIPKLDNTRSRLEGWRYTLGSLLAEKRSFSFGEVPRGVRIQASKTA
jgi:hypothetical protein